MNNRGLTLLEVGLILVVIAILVALYVPVCGGGVGPAKRTSCANNLHQLQVLGTNYSSTYKGEWPPALGSALWLEFTKTVPPLIDQEYAEILGCPVKGDWEPGRCDYLGPTKPVRDLKPEEALAADKPGNHGDDHKGNVLLKDGSVQEYEASHPIWKTLSE